MLPFTGVPCMGAVAQIIDLDSAARWPSAARSDEGKLLYAQFLLKIIVLPRICFHTGFVGEGLGPPARPGITFPGGASPAPTALWCYGIPKTYHFRRKTGFGAGASRHLRQQAQNLLPTGKPVGEGRGAARRDTQAQRSIWIARVQIFREKARDHRIARADRVAHRSARRGTILHAA